MTRYTNGHAKDCDYHLDQYEHECTCGQIGEAGGMSNQELVHGWIVEPNFIGWQAAHPDYDGKNDVRAVFGKTRDEVVAAVAEWVAEYGA